MSNSFKIAAVITAFYARSHADVVVTRWMTTRPTDPDFGWNGPRSTLVSMHCEQITEYEWRMKRGDIGLPLAAEHQVPAFKTVREALTLGGDKLAVDGVLMIGEHGEYPYNGIGQKLYPRKELFDKIVEVYRQTGQVAPIFCDKHLSWNFDWAREMDETARKMGFLLVAGSSIPHCRRHPSWTDVQGRKVREAVELHYGDVEAYGFHGIEYVQSMIEQRAGGESGIRSITAYRGDDVWKQHDAGRWSKTLFDAALKALPPEKLKDGDVRENTQKQPPAAFVVEHLDGLKVTHINLQGHIEDWTAAVDVEGGSAPYAASSICGSEETHFAHFATLSRLVEDAFLTGKPPFAPQRSLLTTGLTEMLMKSLAQPGVTLPTPHLAIAYQPGECATVWDGDHVRK